MNYDIKSIFKHTSIYSVGSLLSKGIGFFMIPLYTHYLNPQDYGILDLLTVLVVLTAIIIQGGISAAIFKFYNTFEKEGDRKEVISTVLIFLVLMSLTSVAVLSTFADNISILLTNSKDYGQYVILMLISFFFSGVAAVPETFLLAQKRSILFTAISLGTLVLDLSMNIYMVAIAKLGILGILYGSIIVRFLNTTFLLSITMPRVGLSLNINKLKKMLGFSCPLIPAQLGLFVFSYSDRLFLSHLSDLKSVGLYSLGYKFAFMISLLMVQPFMQIWQQEMYEVKKKVDAPQIFGSIYTYLVGAILIVGAVMTIFIKDVIAIMASSEYWEAWKVVPFIAFAYVFRATYLYFQMGMLFQNKTSYLSYATTVGAIVVIILNYLLVPVYEQLGAALSVLGSYTVLAVLSFWVSQKLYRIKIEVMRLLRLFLIVGTILAFYLLISIDSKVLSIVFRLTSVPVILFAIYVGGFFNDIERNKIRKLALSRFQ
jgi:O-antigen/teichoic acid export membrane protein